MCPVSGCVLTETLHVSSEWMCVDRLNMCPVSGCVLTETLHVSSGWMCVELRPCVC